MPRLYIHTNRIRACYSLDFGDGGCIDIPEFVDKEEAMCIAIQFGLNMYFVKWNKELDARESGVVEGEFYQVSTPSDRTQRPLPPPVAVCIENEIVVRQLTNQSHVSNRVDKYIRDIRTMTKNVSVKFELIPHWENLARRVV